MNEAFWADQHFDLCDVNNQEIHVDSPQEQLKIQPPSALTQPGSIGAQQAMLDGLDLPLPWVQDLVGRRSKEPEGVIVVGSAYAPFIRGISKRKATLPLVDYVSVSHGHFQRQFLEYVVRPDADYYGKIATLLDRIIEPSQITLFDLCRASYAVRGTRVGRKLDRAAEFTFKRAKCNTLDEERAAQETAKRSRETFIRYIESENQRRWTRSRFEDGKATDIIALGYLAEHGLLRFFYHDLQIRDIAPHRAPHEKWAPDDTQEDRWVIHYAKCSLRTWLTEADWWEMKGTINGQERRWRLLPVLHPCRNAKGDPMYERTRKLFRTMIDS